MSTTHGNSSLEHTTYNTCAVLQALGRPDVPVIRGAPKPLKREAVHAPAFHGESGLGGVDLPKLKDFDLDTVPSGIDRIYRRLKSQPKYSVWFVPTGPLTNLARLLQEHPDVENVIAGVSIMGGAIGDGFTDAPIHRSYGPGNWKPFAEFNIFCDPEAANVVLQHPTLSRKTILAPLDLTHQCCANQSVLDQLFPEEQRLSAVRAMMKQVLSFFASTYFEQSEGRMSGPPVHDPVAVFAVLEPTSVSIYQTREQFDVRVFTEGVQTGRTVVNGASHGSRGVIIPRAIDTNVFWAQIEDCLSSAEAARPMA